MLRKDDEQWLRENYPSLIPSDHGVAGRIEFRAGYNERSNTFSTLGQGTADQGNTMGAVVLSGSFEIRIEERAEESMSRLPALYVKGIDPSPDRHFNQRDQSACLCSPFDEDDFLRPDLQFRTFLEQLVVPFLYGQVFYSSEKRWPWAQYAHGAAGILEAYCYVHDQSRAEECLRKLGQDSNWPRIESALRQEPHMKGHTPCFCPKMDQIRRCHPNALKGALRLQLDLRALGIPVL